MKPEDDFDVQTRVPITEAPNPSARKLPQLPFKRVFTVFVSGFILYFGYNFYVHQKGILEEYKISNNKILEMEKKEAEKSIESMSEWGKLFVNKRDYYVTMSNVFLSYMASLNFPGSEEMKKNIEPMIFQNAQSKFLEILENYKNFKEPDYSKSLGGNEEVFKAINDAGQKDLELFLPLFNFAFEKSSNANDVVVIFRALNIPKLSNGETNVELSEDEKQLIKDACVIQKEKLPTFKGLTAC